MDKSFNEQELSDIMKEIEALEADYEAADESPIEASVEKELSPEDAHDVLKDLSDMEIEKAIPETHTNIRAFKTTEHSMHKSSAKSSMSFKVQGDLTLELALEIAGKSVILDVSETGLTIKMENGVTFNVPMSENTAYKKAV
jgi:hypothetical protein